MVEKFNNLVEAVIMADCVEARHILDKSYELVCDSCVHLASGDEMHQNSVRVKQFLTGTAHNIRSLHSFLMNSDMNVEPQEDHMKALAGGENADLVEAGKRGRSRKGMKAKFEGGGRKVLTEVANQHSGWEGPEKYRRRSGYEG
ncbi:hypothetical protein VNO78_05811 [Psophocarpus tetragonolobus]|uniref:Uncharacterized protein n=1 Tax=Psophocarpus tetragonolobus TaxID=3891 RepID=A0AAN9XRS2_PSOTE